MIEGVGWGRGVRERKKSEQYDKRVEGQRQTWEKADYVMDRAMHEN